MFELLLPPPVLAHQIRIDQAVAGTLHLEPNDQPQAGVATPTWIALRQPGGAAIVAQDCDCQLQLLNAQTGATTELAVVPLAVAPGAVATEIIFPAVGQYELQLQGRPTPAAQTAFRPFQIRFPVTVAIAAPSEAATPATHSPTKAPTEPTTEADTAAETRSWLRVLIPVSIGLGLLAALAAGVWLILKRDRAA